MVVVVEGSCLSVSDRLDSPGKHPLGLKNYGGLTRCGAVQGFFADDEGLNVRIPACWACDVLDGNEVVG